VSNAHGIAGQQPRAGFRQFDQQRLVAGRVARRRDDGRAAVAEHVVVAFQLNVKDLSVDQIERLTAVMEHLTDLSLNDRTSFGHLCAIRAAIDAAVTTDDLVTLRLTGEQCAFLLALVEQEIREHA
jgi:hypothetical protein